jgi:hypothetical protein
MRASSRWRSRSRAKAVEAVRRLAGAHAGRWLAVMGDVTVAVPPPQILKIKQFSQITSKFM